jgi:hypothetical protein
MTRQYVGQIMSSLRQATCPRDLEGPCKNIPGTDIKPFRIPPMPTPDTSPIPPPPSEVPIASMDEENGVFDNSIPWLNGLPPEPLDCPSPPFPNVIP